MFSPGSLRRLVTAAIGITLAGLILVGVTRWYLGGFQMLTQMSAATPLLLGLMGVFVALHEDWAKQHKPVVIALFVLVSGIGFLVTTEQDRRLSSATTAAQSALANSVSAPGAEASEIKEEQDRNTELQNQLINSNAELVTSSRQISELSSEAVVNSRESLSNIMGTGSVPFVIPQTALPLDPIPLGIFNGGKHLLTGVTVVIKRQLDPPPQTAEDLFKRQELAVGTLHPGLPRLLSERISPKPDSNGMDFYDVYISTQSETFEQLLEFRRGTNGFLWAYRYVVWQDVVRLDRSRASLSGRQRMVIPMTAWSDEKRHPLFEIGP